MWVTTWATVLCVGISLLSLYFSLQAKFSSEKETCFLKIEKAVEDYLTEIHRIVSSGIDKPVEVSFITTIWDCTVINTGDKPFTIVGYRIADPKNQLNYENQELEYCTHIENTDSLPRRLAPGESFVMRISNSTEIDPRAYSILKKENPSNEQFSIVSVFNQLYRRQIDLFGNPVKCDFDETGIKTMVIDWNKIKNDDPFIISLRTAKGNVFSAAGCWYDKSDVFPFDFEE